MPSGESSNCLDKEGKDCDVDYSNSNETGPLDSHEAMNTRSKRSADADKRVFRNMLLGLYKKSEQQQKLDKYKVQETQVGICLFNSIELYQRRCLFVNSKRVYSSWIFIRVI